MVSSDVIRNAVGIVGNIISFALFLSPMPTIIDIWKMKSVKQYAAAPYLATLINCLVLIVYGLPPVNPNNLLVLSINATGAAVELVYITIFIVFSDKKTRLKVMLILVVEFIFIVVLTVLVLSLAHTTKKKSLVVGCFSICFSILMYASPLSIMKVVITTKSVEYMPFLLSLATFGNATTWFAYAFIHFDSFLVIPNGVGASLSIIQLILYAMFYKSTKRQLQARKAVEGEMALSEVDYTKQPETVANPT